MFPILKTERTILRSFNEDDAENAFELIFAHKQEFGGDDFKNVKTFEDCKYVNSETVKSDNEFIIIDNNTQKPIGWILCTKALGYKITKRTWFHMWIRNEYRHIGLGREILEKLMNFAFYGIQTENVVTNVKNSEKKAYQLMLDLGFDIYNHFPKTKIIDDNTTIQFKISKEKYLKQKYAYINSYDYEVPKYKPPQKVVSPYSYDNPIRKIDSIQYIKQPTGALCGQAVVAMLANVTVDEVISVMKTDQGTSVYTVQKTLEYYGLKTSTKARIKYDGKSKLPECCVLSVKLPDYGHWSLYYKGKFYDPEFGVLDELPKNAKLISFWKL